MRCSRATGTVPTRRAGRLTRTASSSPGTSRRLTQRHDPPCRLTAADQLVRYLGAGERGHHQGVLAAPLTARVVATRSRPSRLSPSFLRTRFAAFSLRPLSPPCCLLRPLPQLLIEGGPRVRGAGPARRRLGRACRRRCSSDFQLSWPVVSLHANTSLSVEQLQSHCKQQLAKYKVPSALYVSHGLDAASC
jgi:hypothetical protein